GLTERPTVFNCHVMALEEAGFAQAPSECLHQMRRILGRPGAEIPNRRHRRLLPSCRKRPRSCRPAEQDDELAPPQVEHATLLPVAGTNPRPRSAALSARPRQARGGLRGSANVFNKGGAPPRGRPKEYRRLRRGRRPPP